jgi:putative membrane protein
LEEDTMMYGWENGMDAGWWVLMSVVWIALIALIVWAVVSLFSGPDSHARRDDARSVLDRRLASGEIDAGTYDQLRERLDRGALAGGR